VGEHELAVSLHPSRRSLPLLRSTVVWAPCVHEARATLLPGDAQAAAPPRGTTNMGARLVHPAAKEPAEWCFGAQAQKVVDMEHDTGGTQ
jgi:hypothetical protein